MQTIGLRWNMQADCPLFNMIPAEIRDRIFSFALSPFDNHNHPYKLGQHWYRPGYHYPQMLDTRLLQTCKRIYEECRLMPIKLNEFVLYLLDGPIYRGWGRQGLFRNPETGTGGRLHCLTQTQQQSIENVHCFVQQFYLENWLAYQAAWEGLSSAKRLTLTLRRTDWWSWESDVGSPDRLGICPWLLGRTTCQAMEAEPINPTLEYIRSNMDQGVSPSGQRPFAVMIWNLPQLEVLEIEFEAEVKKKDQLAVVVDRAKGWKFPREDGSHLLWNGEVKESRWEGLARPVEEDEEYNSGSDEEEFQEIHAESNAEDVGDSSVTEDRTEPPQLTETLQLADTPQLTDTLQLADTLQLTDTLQPAETTHLTHVVAVLTFRLVKCSTTFS